MVGVKKNVTTFFVTSTMMIAIYLHLLIHMNLKLLMIIALKPDVLQIGEETIYVINYVITGNVNSIMAIVLLLMMIRM
jgi:hypothetical protein